MAIYGTPLTMGGGGGGQNSDLPPLLDGFKAQRVELGADVGLVPPGGKTIAFKDIPDAAKIKLVKGSNISGTVTYGTTNDLNHRIVFDSKDWTRKQFLLDNDDSSEISGSDIDQWLNATKASGWWTNQSINTISPDYANEQGFLYQLGITDELLAQNFNDINIDKTNKAKVGLPCNYSNNHTLPPYTFFSSFGIDEGAGKYALIDDGSAVYLYRSFRFSTKGPGLGIPLPLDNIESYIHPMMEPKPETQVALDADGSYYMFEKQKGVTLSADKMEESRAKDLAGAVWVYGEHEPKNVNDGTKLEITRDEILNVVSQARASGRNVGDLASKSKVKLGRYAGQKSPPLERTVAWDKKKEFYARQFTYNSKKQYQTMLEGAIAYLPIMPDGQELSKLPSKSKVKLGKFNGNPLKWLICRDSVDQSLRLILDGESMGVLGDKMFDNSEPNNSDSNRRSYGNNRYIWSNIRQWLNSSSPANSWYSSQHSADAPPNYTNVAGFLHEWTEKEISVLENASWVVTRHSVDGGGTESFQNRIVLPSTTEMGLESGTGGSKLDIFKNDGDRVVTGKHYWCRTPYPSYSYSVRVVVSRGALGNDDASYAGFGVRPLCKPTPTTLVSFSPDSDGCYTLI